MFDKLAQLFSASQAPTETDEQHLSQLAATALLIELCRADNSVDAVEIAEVISIAQSTFKLSEQAAEKLLADAQQKNDEATSLFEFTEIINRQFDKAAKYQLIKHIWQVAYADKKIDQHEDHLIRKVADLIYVGHGDFIRAKHEMLAEQE
ncbi:MAG: TerB family tellurite resistance protein [Pseudomonadales bacterium]|nr:TerB family tellurite resistance protein [Pseudomonadales bacterium]